MEAPLVKVKQGQLRGIIEKNVNGKSFLAFRGVPYAKPPVGNLRFKDPEPPVSWSGVKNATEFRHRCAQEDWITRKIIGSDDCLYLNVYTTKLIETIPRAVMVYIHGGSFICGSGEDVMFGPDYLIEREIVLVTINYRVGIFGFLNVDDEEAPGNQGLKDQVLALKWIQQNIAQFGGDPNNVTIFGQSAGGASVHYLTISPLAQGLFNKAIIQSGVATNCWASSLNSPLESVKKLGIFLNKDTSDVKEFVNYLRTFDAYDLVRAEIKIRTHQDDVLYIYPFLPSVDLKAKDPFLTSPIQEAAKAGIKVPSICGYVAHEALMLVGAMNDEKYAKIDEDPENLLVHPSVVRFLKEYNVTIGDFKRFYFGDEKISAKCIDKFVDMNSAAYFTIGIHDIIKIQSKTPNIPMYFYKFEYELETSISKKLLGVNMK
ncbi:hypothetical protein PV325_010529, partial [Microctonus aethiopoides]